MSPSYGLISHIVIRPAPQTGDALKGLLETVNAVHEALCSKQAENLLLIKQSPRYVARLAQSVCRDLELSQRALDKLETYEYALCELVI